MGPRADQGLFFLCMNGLLRAVTKKAKDTVYSVRISYLEIYNEQVRDLLTSDP
jgi:kinesin family protein 18/19